MSRFRNLSNNQKIAYIAVLAALGVVINFIELPYPPVPYLKLDFSEVVVLVAYTISIPAAVTVSFLKALILGLVHGIDIGIVSLFIGSLSIVFGYHFGRKIFKATEEFDIKKEIKALAFATFVFVVTMHIANFTFVTPIYSGLTMDQMITDAGLTKYTMYIFATYAPFNLMKGALVSTLYILVAKAFERNTQTELDIEL